MSRNDRRYDRRTFIARGLEGAGALAIGATAGGFLSACGGSSPGSSPTSGHGLIGIGQGRPKRGGTITIGMNSEIDGFLPTTNHFDNTGLTYATTVFDALTKIAPDGTVHPYLAQSVTPMPI